MLIGINFVLCTLDGRNNKIQLSKNLKTKQWEI